MTMTSEVISMPLPDTHAGIDKIGSILLRSIPYDAENSFYHLNDIGNQPPDTLLTDKFDFRGFDFHLYQTLRSGCVYAVRSIKLSGNFAGSRVRTRTLILSSMDYIFYFSNEEMMRHAIDNGNVQLVLD